MDYYQTAAFVTCVLSVAYTLHRRYDRPLIKDIRGPGNPSWIFGHQWYLQSEEAGVTERRFFETYGSVVRWNGPLGEDRLWIADPKALHHILELSGYLYEKPYAFRERHTLTLDRGVFWAAGDAHKRHRRAVIPAFGPPEVKALVPAIAQSANNLVDKWQEIIEGGDDGDGLVMNVNRWFGKATLDAIGAGGFDHDFGAVGGTENTLTKSYEDLAFRGISGTVSRGLLFFTNASKRVPERMVHWVFNHSNHPELMALRYNGGLVRELARSLLESKRKETKGVTRRDIMSLLVRSGASLKPDRRLSDDEIVSQIRTILFTGHEPVAKTLTFALWELAKNRQYQERLRAEIDETLKGIRARGDSDFTANDFETMPWLVALIKETLRVHSINIEVIRAPTRDDIIPLSKPVIGASGKIYNELPIHAGTPIFMSLLGYNMNRDVWGPDADVFRPDRWFEMNEKPETALGVYGNLASFSGGHRSCIGWRFALIETQVFLVTLIRRFDFSLPENPPRIKRSRGILISPVVVGEEAKGCQLPLKVVVLSNG